MVNLEAQAVYWAQGGIRRTDLVKGWRLSAAPKSPLRSLGIKPSPSLSCGSWICQRCFSKVRQRNYTTLCTCHAAQCDSWSMGSKALRRQRRPTTWIPISVCLSDSSKQWHAGLGPLRMGQAYAAITASTRHPRSSYATHWVRFSSRHRLWPCTRNSDTTVMNLHSIFEDGLGYNTMIHVLRLSKLAMKLIDEMTETQNSSVDTLGYSFLKSPQLICFGYADLLGMLRVRHCATLSVRTISQLSV